MTDEREDRARPMPKPTEVIYLPKARRPRTEREEALREVELTIASHFREQNELLLRLNAEQRDSIQRLQNGIERLIGEMHGVRTGKQEEAFARVAPAGTMADLPTVPAEASIIYTHTSKSIGTLLGFSASQIGTMLGAKGLKWAGNGAYQEMGRTTNPGHSKFWHQEVPERLKRILDENDPAKHGITDKALLAMFRRWQQRHANADLLSTVDPSPTSH